MCELVGSSLTQVMNTQSSNGELKLKYPFRASPASSWHQVIVV